MPMFQIQEPLNIAKIRELAQERFGDMVKAVVDVADGSMVVGCELHVDAEQLLLEKGSKQANLWGINLYPDAFGDNERFVEFDSMINLRPSQGNRSRGVEDPEIRQRILGIVGNRITNQ